jgi:hypothetical protein
MHKSVKGAESSISGAQSRQQGQHPFDDSSAILSGGPGVAGIGRQPIALPGNGNPILILILVLINWVEGVLNFTYVESI